MRIEEQLGLRQPRDISALLQIEQDRVRTIAHHGLRKGRLAALARPKYGDRRGFFEGFAQAFLNESGDISSLVFIQQD